MALQLSFSACPDSFRGNATVRFSVTLTVHAENSILVVVVLVNAIDVVEKKV